MRISRRLYLAFSAIVIGSWIFRDTRAANASVVSNQNINRKTFSLLVDTIVPTDSTPGAIDVGIDRILIRHYEDNEWNKAAIDRLIEKLNMASIDAHRLSFSTLDLERRTDLVNGFLYEDATDVKSRIAFKQLRNLELQKFYTSEQGFQLVDYHPPSRGGYPDYARVPKIR